jgi:glycerol-3-phosphate acyltransferase PlsY
MGARNTTGQFGLRAGLLVAIIDMAKGALAILLAMAFKLPLVWQMAAGVAAVLGHDFSIFAQFRGGKGLATTGGVFIALFPLPGLIGLGLQILVYLIFKNWDLGSGICMGVFTLLVILTGEPLISIGFIIPLLLLIPIKKWLDKPRDEKIQEQDSFDSN